MAEPGPTAATVGTLEYDPAGPATTPGPDVSGPRPQPTAGSDRYELRELLAQGGMGEVYLAQDRSLNRIVAVKVLRHDLRERAPIVARFLEEARITARFQHPGIPPIHDLGTLPDGRPFLAMKLIKGHTLAADLAGGATNRADLLRVFEQIAQTVAYAHSKQVIHRDLKPANVMVGAFGEVQVMDWGLAKPLRDGSVAATVVPDEPAASVIESEREGHATQAGTLLGTPAYMPPEQARGELDRVNTRADVFALGAILCELLTGEPPYTGSTQVVRALAITAQLEPAYERLAGCGADAELVALARRCLAADPAERPASAAAVADAIQSYRTGVAKRLRQAEVEQAAAAVRAAEARRRKRAQLALIAVTALLVLGGGAFAWWSDRLTRARQAEDEKQTQVEQARLLRNTEAIEALLAQAEEAVRALNPDAVALPLAQIDRRVSEGGGDALQERIDRCRADHALLRALERADELFWTGEEWKLRSERASAAIARACADYGIVPGQTPLAEAVRRINAAPLRTRLLQALDLWYLHVPGPRPSALRKLLEAADPDPFRIEVRNAFTRSDKAWHQALLDDPQAVLQPAWFAAVWAQAHNFPAAGREQILRRALERSPNDFPLVLTMGLILESSTSERRTEVAIQALRWAQAAVSLRPQSKVSWRNLGRVYWDRGEVNDSVRCYRKAVRLDPDDYNSWTQYCAVLLRKHDPEAALEAAHQALDLNPNYAQAHATLGSVYERMGDRARAIEHFVKAVEIDEAIGYETASTRNSYGYALLCQGDYDRAIQQFRECLRSNPTFRLAQTNLDEALKRKAAHVAGTIEYEEGPPPREKGVNP